VKFVDGRDKPGHEELIGSGKFTRIKATPRAACDARRPAKPQAQPESFAKAA
jgi:hypothetical protein